MKKHLIQPAKISIPLTRLTVQRRIIFVALGLFLSFDASAQAQAETPLRTWTSKGLEKSKYRVYETAGGLVYFSDGSLKARTSPSDFTRIRPMGLPQLAPDDFSKDDLDYLESFSILPPAGDPKTTDFETNDNPLLPFGIKRSLSAYSKMRALRLKKLYIDVLGPEDEREKRWSELGVPDGYFPKKAANEFEKDRQRQQFLKEVKAFKPFRFAKEVYVAPWVPREKYDFKRGGYTFALPNLLLVQGGKELSKVGFLPVPPDEAENFPKGISRRCLITLHPVGIKKEEIGFSIVFEPVKAKIYHESPRGIWKDAKSEPALNDLFTTKENTNVKVNTEYNEVFIAK